MQTRLKKKSLSSLPETEHRDLHYPIRSLVTTRTEISRLLQNIGDLTK